MPPPTTVSVPIRLGRTTTRIKDSVKIHANVDVGLTNANPLRVCAVCHENESKYTCPRCNAVYCGVPCYKTHGSTCTEQFYKGHVESEMRLNKTSDTVREMQEMLQRVHDEFPETSPLDARIDDLVELLENNSLTLDKLTQEERTNFLREVADGRLGKFITLWEPWWMQSITAYESTTQGLRQSLIVALDGIDDESDDFDDDVALRHPIGLFTNTLESKLPPTIFDLHPSPNHEALECNLVDILFAYSFVMRMYNGDWRVDVLEAGALCISSSAVLQGKAHTNVLGQVVFACRAQTRIADADAAAKNAALADVTSILGQRLFILDSLCDLLLLVESLQAEGASKKKKDLNRVAKKVEFHIVWAKDAATSMCFPRLQQQLIQAIDQATPTL